MDAPLPVHTFNEAQYYLMVTACEACGKGPWQIDSTDPSPPRAGLILVKGRCTRCGAQREFRFLCEDEGSGEAVRNEQINPAEKPSRIIDLGQWLSLFHMLIESAASTARKTEARRTGFRAALCLAEALKFYTDDELPPDSSFFTEKSLTAFREHPEKFARQRLRDMQTKLPSLPRMARSVARDERPQRGRWWEFWK